MELTVNEPQNRQVTGFTWASAFKRISSLALPMAGSYTFSIEVWLLVLLLSRVNSDKEHTAAITLTTSMINALAIAAISPLFPMSMIAGRFLGNLNRVSSVPEVAADSVELVALRDDIARVNHHGLMVATSMIPVVTLPMVFSGAILTHGFGQNPAVAQISQSFLRYYALAMPGLLYRVSSEQMMFTFGHNKSAMMIALLNAALCIGMSAILALGLFGAPKMGQEGLLLGYTLDSYLTALAYALYIAFHPDLKIYNFFRPRALLEHLGKIKEQLSLGGSIALGNVIEMGALLGTGTMAGLCGLEGQAAFSMTMQCTLLTFLLQAAIAQSTCQEMSRLIGEHRFSDASRMGTTGIITTSVYIAPLPILFAIKPDWLMDILGQDDGQERQILRVLFPIMSAAIVLEALRYQWLQQLRNNLNDATRATLISSLSLMAGLLLSWVLGTKTDLGVYGVAIGYLSALCVAGASLALRWHKRVQTTSLEGQYLHRHSMFAAAAPRPTPEQMTNTLRLLDHYV